MQLGKSAKLVKPMLLNVVIVIVESALNPENLAPQALARQLPLPARGVLTRRSGGNVPQARNRSPYGATGLGWPG